MAAQAQRNQQQEEEYEEAGPMLISKLESCGINASDVRKLQEAGYNTVEACAYVLRFTYLSMIILLLIVFLVPFSSRSRLLTYARVLYSVPL